MLVCFALGIAKVLTSALGEAKVPNANGFTSQWNIGFKVQQLCVFHRTNRMLSLDSLVVYYAR